MPQTIRDIMTKDVEIVTPESTLTDAARIMKDKDIGSLPVCEGRRAVGMITDRDIAVRAVADGKDPASTRVGEVMSKDVVTVTEDADLKEAERLMTDRQLRRLPVVNDRDELVGYLAMARVARSDNAEAAGRVIKGVSEKSKPASTKRP